MSSNNSPRYVLPPIITNDNDRVFLSEINEFIKENLKITENFSAEHEYIVYKQVFEKVIDYLTTYKPLLGSIKSHYEKCIDALRNHRYDQVNVDGKMAASYNIPDTLRNYKHRADELDHKSMIVQRDNDRLRSEVEKLRSERTEKQLEVHRRQEEEKKKLEEFRTTNNKLIPGLTLEQSTDLQYLRQYLAKLDQQYRDLSLGYRTRYLPRALKDSLKDELELKIAARDKLKDEIKALKHRHERLKIASDASAMYVRYQPPHQTIGDAVLLALAQASKTTTDDSQDDVMLTNEKAETDDSDLIMDYIERFNELMEQKKYEEAAIHAANSPRAVLRTDEVLQRFKNAVVDKNTSMARSPLLAFCDALMSTVLVYKSKPNVSMSLECTRCALQENRLDLIIHWLSQDRMSVSRPMADVLYTFCTEKSRCTRGCIALAQKIYMEVGCHVEAMVCLIHQEKTQQAVSYGQDNNCTMDDYLKLLSVCPSVELASAIFEVRDTSGQRIVALGQLIGSLVDKGQSDIACHLLQDIYKQHSEGSTDDKSTSLRNAVAEDKVTTSVEWTRIAQMCDQHGYNNCAVNIVAMATVMTAVHRAATDVSIQQSAA